MEPTARTAALPRRTGPSHDELDRRLSEHGASLWNWVLLREAAHADGASQRELAAPHAHRAADARAPPRQARRGRPGRAAARPRRPPRRARRRHRRRAARGSTSCTTSRTRSTPSCAAILTEREVEVLGTRAACASTTTSPQRSETRSRAVSQRETEASDRTVADDEVIRTEQLTKVYPGRHHGGRRARPRGAPGRDLRPARPERRGQDHHRRHAHDARDPHQRARVRRRHRRRRAPDRGEAGDRRRAADATRSTARSRVWENLYFHGRFFGMTARDREAPRPTALLEQFRLADRGDGAGGARSRAAWRSGSWWRGRSCTGPRCCSSTSRPPGSIRRAASRCGRSSASCTREGQTILLTTHYMEEADQLCDRLAIIDHGRLLALGHARPS